MKLQGFSIIFALVAIPLILVLTYYIQLQVDTITLQTRYDSKLLDATYDAMSSFELNTANEDLSSVSDSLRTIIEASNNVFFNTLSTNLGLSNASKSYVEPYIPAILYTLYDGYYISAPTQVPEFCMDYGENAVSVGDLGVVQDPSSPNTYTYTKLDKEEQETLPDDRKQDLYASYNTNNDYGQLLYLKKGTTDRYTTDINYAELKTKNVLKTYMPYSARYKNLPGETNQFDITVVYTLDNYVTIEGKIRNIYYTKSGYLIPMANNAVSIEPQTLLNFNENDAQAVVESGQNVKITIGDAEFESGGISYSDLTTNLNSLKNELLIVQNGLAEKYKTRNTADQSFEDLLTRENNLQGQINDVQYALDQMAAVIYYTKAAIFSNWVNNNLNNATNGILLQEKHLVEISGQSYTSINGTENVSYSFANSEVSVFDTHGNTNNGVTEIAVDSPYYNHKLNVIRNSIQYNLNLAMSTYNSQMAHSYSYEMPVMQNEEWSRILNNISIVSFMQGYSCGLKTYNNYMVVSSTNNEITVSPKNIYYVPKDQFSNESSEYHRIDCPKVIGDYKVNGGVASSDLDNTEYRTFSSKEVKYDKISTSKFEWIGYIYDHKNLACYDCINDGNYMNTNIFDDTNTTDYSKYRNLRKAYYIALGKEKNNLYKMNAISKSEGYEIIYNNNDSNLSNSSNQSSKPISEIKEIEIVLGTIKTRNIRENLRYKYTFNGKEIVQVTPNSITSNQTMLTTVVLTIDSNTFNTPNDNNFKISLSNLGIENLLPTETTYLNAPNEDPSAYGGNKAKTIFNHAVKYIRVIYK